MSSAATQEMAIIRCDGALGELESNVFMFLVRYVPFLLRSPLPYLDQVVAAKWNSNRRRQENALHSLGASSLTLRRLREFLNS